MMAFIGGFSQPFILAVILWPFMSALLTLPVLAYLYHRENRIRFTSVLASYGSVLYLLSLACFTLYPLPEDPERYCAAHHVTPQLDVWRFVGDLQYGGLDALLQILFNVVFFMPLGFILGRFVRMRLRFALPLCFLTSLLIETSQLTGIFGLYPCAYRLFDVDDLIWNTSGGLLGLVVAIIANHLIPTRAVDDDVITTQPGFLRRSVAFCIDYAWTLVLYVPLTSLIYLIEVNVTGSRPLTFTMGGVMFLGCYAVMELIVPAARHGRTLGSGFVRMSVETKPRTGFRRAAFYLVRFSVLAVVAHWIAGTGQAWMGWFTLALIVFWIAAHRMPYDFI